jgi:hypothetical protein
MSLIWLFAANVQHVIHNHETLVADFFYTIQACVGRWLKKYTKKFKNILFWAWDSPNQYQFKFFGVLVKSHTRTDLDCVNNLATNISWASLRTNANLMYGWEEIPKVSLWLRITHNLSYRFPCLEFGAAGLPYPLWEHREMYPLVAERDPSERYNHQTKMPMCVYLHTATYIVICRSLMGLQYIAANSSK